MTRLYEKTLEAHYERDNLGGQFIVIRRGLAFTFRVRLSEATALADQLIDIIEEVNR